MSLEQDEGQASRRNFLELEEITKAFASNVVLDGVDAQFQEGRVYGILGENGAGKSTLIKIISGLEYPNAGEIRVQGSPVRFKAPRAALDAGITVITQEQTLVPSRSVAENVYLGQWPASKGFVRDKQMLKQFEELRDRVGFDHLDPVARTSSLSLAARQQVEILRAIAHDSRVIIMDEPTAILSAVETQQLLELIRKLARQGVCVLLISHFLEDVLSVADEVLVLRDGKVTLNTPAGGQSSASLTAAMVGRDVEFDQSPPINVAPDAPVRLAVDQLTCSSGVGPVSLEVRAGEIVGLAGLVGSGRTELARAIFGADKVVSGSVTVDGSPLQLGSTRRAIRKGIAMISEDRKEDGLCLIHSIRENTSIVARSDYAVAGFRTEKSEKAAVARAMVEAQVKAVDQQQALWSLSGGNQQKVLFSKWTIRRPKVLIVDEPTRGVDVGAKGQIHAVLRQLAEEGIAILLISSEVEEVMALSHRLLVMHQGLLINEMPWGTADRTEIIRAAFGGVTNQG